MMTVDPFLGMFLLVVAALAGGSFYVPFAKVKMWSWETYWLTQGIVAWLVMPVLVAWLTTPDLSTVFVQCSTRSLVLTFMFGVMWGVGSVTFGLSVRYLGISLGMTVVVGLCAAFGTLIPPVVDGLLGQLLATHSGWTVLSGVLLCLVGIVLCGCAGARKSHELTDQQKQASIREFALVKGFVVATISGVMSAGMVYGLHAGKPIAQAALASGASIAYQNNAVFVVILAGGFVVQAIFCLTMNICNQSMRQYAAGPAVLLLRNYTLVGLAGILWYTQLLFYGMGTTTMGEYAFAAWSILTALVMVISMLWGLALKEWKGVSARTLSLVWSGIAVLVLSAMVIGAGSHLAASGR